MSSELLLLIGISFSLGFTPGPNNAVASYSAFNFGFRKTLPIILGVLAGTFLLFDKNSESITIYFFRDNGYDIPGYLAFIGFIMIGVIIGYIISLKSVFSYRSEISKLVKSN